MALVADGHPLLALIAPALRGESHGHAGHQQSRHRRNYAKDPDPTAHTKPTPLRRWTRAVHQADSVAGTGPFSWIMLYRVSVDTLQPSRVCHMASSCVCHMASFS